jgi:hypothetical protein
MVQVVQRWEQCEPFDQSMGLMGNRVLGSTIRPADKIHCPPPYTLMRTVLHETTLVGACCS